jgi:hypothetical protein
MRPDSADADPMAAGMLSLRRDDRCISCGVDLPAGTKAWWDPAARAVTCRPCREVSARHQESRESAKLERGRAGASLGREYERRRTNREKRIRAAHPRLGRLLLALTDAPQHEVAFRRGEAAEKAVADDIERRTADGPAIRLDNRRMPGGRGDIDHLVVAASGVFVVDTKDWAGSVRIDRSMFEPPKLLIDGRDRSRMIDGLERQVAAVRTALDEVGRSDVSVQGALCFTRADLPLHRTQQLRGQLLLYRRALAKRLNASGPLDAKSIDEIARQLSVAFPPA